MPLQAISLQHQSDPSLPPFNYLINGLADVLTLFYLIHNISEYGTA